MAIIFGNHSGSNFSDQLRIAALEKENRMLRDQVARLSKELYLEKHKDMPVISYEEARSGYTDELR